MFVLIPLLMLTAPAQAYYGRHSTEAVLTYHGDADVRWTGPASVALLNSRAPEHGQALERIHEQVQHLMGTFQSESFRHETQAAGALGETYEVRFTEVARGSAPGRMRLSYDFRGVVVFQKEVFSGHESKLIPVRLPLAPDLIYGLSLVRNHGKDRSRCTDREFNGEDDFWYYWDPEMPSCPLAGNEQDVLRITGKLTRLANTRVTYPEYDRLYGDNGNGNALDIAVFIGYIRDQDGDGARPSRRDEALRALKYIDRDLMQREFDLVEEKNFFRVDPDGAVSDGINFLHRYRKAVATAGGTLDVRIEVLLADTDMESTDETFHHYLVPALRKADILVYDGHSNLGANFDLNKLPPVAFNPNKYQIFFFNGCSTYPYVNGMYFRAKGGTLNTEIVTAGLPTFAESSGPNAMAFMDHFLEGETLSYQKILTDLEDSNGNTGTYLIGVKGDEDNTWTPGR
ncbi:MAG: hypothetical protein HY074_05705 [Deltaproteobacteria bacterium]|nr:hypothetical protein [Deltaproteobacteria bacterium]